MTTCATCKNWQPRESAAMAQHRLCRCAHRKPWVYLPPHASCNRFAAVDKEAAGQRIEWISKHRATRNSSTAN